MGCAPSQSSIDILVKQRHNHVENQEQKKEGLSPSINSRHDSFLEKSCLLEEEFQDEIQDEGFLQESLTSNISKLSTKSNTSWDSGLYELDDEYSHIITENSEPSKVQEVNKQHLPGDGVELLLEGKACPRKLSSRDREKVEQQAVLDILKGEGLAIRPCSRAVGGIRFDFVLAQDDPSTSSSLCPKLPPINIHKKYRRKKAELTYEEIEQKLIKAEERRKKTTEKKLHKLATKDRREIQAIAKKQAETTKLKLEEKLLTKMQCREKHLVELRDKLKAREEHARKVRERKQIQESGFKYIMPP